MVQIRETGLVEEHKEGWGGGRTDSSRPGLGGKWLLSSKSLWPGGNISTLARSSSVFFFFLKNPHSGILMQIIMIFNSREFK